MQVSLEFFGPIADRMRDANSTATLEASPADARELIDMLVQTLPGGESLQDPHLQLAINDELVTAGSAIALAEGDRIAILSPFSGG